MIDIDSANTTAVTRMMEARPVLTGLGKAIDVISMIGINLAATKELAKKVETMSKKMAKSGVNRGV